MARLRILAGGNSSQAQAQARGKLFEVIMADVLRHYGYRIDRTPNVNFAGMEIDIEGEALVTGIPLYAECKCYDTEVDSTKLQAFAGKYLALWLRDKKCQGLFIALPGVNSHAKGFYRDNLQGKPEITVRLLEEEQVIEAIFHTKHMARPDTISALIDPRSGTPGDWGLLYTDRGLFWIQYVVPPGHGIATGVALFDALGTPLSDKATYDYLTRLSPELGELEPVTFGDRPALAAQAVPQEPELIVEVRGSSSCFEYQFPASPAHFVGRKPTLADLDSFVTALLHKETSSRGILFEANSGWGKSSVILASVAQLTEKGHFAVAIDCRSASSSQFILRVVSYILTKFGDFDGLVPSLGKHPTISGFEGAVRDTLALGQTLERHGRIMFVFFDQFENVFLLPDTLRRIRDLFLKACDAQTNVVLGFSWKTDLVGLTRDFPYQLRDAIEGSSRRVVLGTFSDVETNALLNKLSEEIKARLRADLRFFLSEFSQGYPWLLKKLCAHVKAQREKGVPQSQIASSLLNVEELFQEDMRGLSAEQEDALRRIAKAAPIGVSEIGEEFSPDLVQSLVNARLVVRIGNKYDVYWDIFRDYLNAGRVPVQENYILRMQVGSVLKAVRLLSEADGSTDVPEFQKQAGLSAKAFYNVARDMKLLGLAKADEGKVQLAISVSKEGDSFEKSLRNYLRDRLQRNRLVQQLLRRLELDGRLTIDQASDLLASSCPYISATHQTWQTYARILSDWLDFADLVVYDSHDNTLAPHTIGTEVHERRVS